ncbi:MAG: hypothetical protein OXF02_00185 [Simkaniaceae bacterium]|nr:hypothetical protein [Simkaniaceae bacterium]
MTGRFNILFFLVLSAFAHTARGELIVLEGYLGAWETNVVHEKLTKIAEEGKEKEVMIRLSSSSGEMGEALRLSQALFQLRAHGNVKVHVYIRGRAVGPAAMIPFTADRVLTTPLSAWGDIRYGVDEDIPPDPLKGMVKGVMNPQLADRAVLERVIDAMIDPYSRMADVGESSSPESFDPDKEGEEPLRAPALILNTEKMRSLNLVSEVVSDEEFARRYGKSERAIDSDIFPGASERSLKRTILFDPEGENPVGVFKLAIDDVIRPATYLRCKFAIEEFKKRKVCFILFIIDTFGGEVLSSLKIVDLLQKTDLEHGIPTVAYIDSRALSAGAMIAYGCRHIFVNGTSIMGAAEPVLSDGRAESLPASEKVVSALRAEFANLAHFYGRNPLLAEGMVDKDLILVLRDHKIIRLNNMSEVRSGEPSPDLLIVGKGKLLTMNARQLIDLNVADVLVDKGHPRPVFTDPFLSTIPRVVFVEHSDWRVRFFAFLSHPAVISLIFLLLVLGFYTEINTPGFGIPGLIGVVCFVLILLSGFATEAINWIEVMILLFGLILLAVELFFIPGSGVFGILGIVLTVLGLFALMLPGIGKLDISHWDRLVLLSSTLVVRLTWLITSLVFAVILILLLARFCRDRFFRFSRLVLHEHKEGISLRKSDETLPEEGEIGIAITALRPSGKVRIGTKRYDATLQAGYAESGTPVEVTGHSAHFLIVRPTDTPEEEKGEEGGEGEGE